LHFNKKSQIIDNDNLRKYELAYNSITHKTNLEKPFLNEYKSDASGVKIIPKIYIIDKSDLYSKEYFGNDKIIASDEIKILSKKYSKSGWRKDKDYKVLTTDELKDFHGPLKYFYFSEIKNDSLRADILGNPFANYSMTTGEHYLIIFENNYIKSIEKKISHYD